MAQFHKAGLAIHLEFEELILDPEALESENEGENESGSEGESRSNDVIISYNY